VLLLNNSILASLQKDNIPNNILKAQKILDLIIKNKYFLSAQLLYAKLKFIIGDRKTAINSLQSLLQADPKNFEAKMLYSFVIIENQDYHKAKEIINEIMISNLPLTKDNVYFYILKSKCEMGLAEFENSQKSLNEALKIFDKNVSKPSDCNFI
jgi:tetratricopeptide (TPR) repeat protein